MAKKTIRQKRLSQTVLFLLFTFILASITSCNSSVKDNPKPTVQIDTLNTDIKTIFERIQPNHSKLFFENIITENIETNENLFNYDYFYNGAGVGVEDMNNDGLLDIFFCGNQVPNKLFLNKGGFVFEDISESAGINNGKQWSNGVSFVDINTDGWMDIYISQGGPKTREQRKNLLFINQKDNTFLEMGEKFGLADMGISTQSAFFDYDKDGDLDCIVMNENEFYGVDPINLYRMVKNNPEAIYFNSSHFYKNEDGLFEDVTKQSGIERPIFGLGLAVSDINNDGWQDIYIASDYYIPDALFINNGDGSFNDKIKEYTNHTSFYGMGIDIADANNDAKQDIFVLDMAANDHKRSKTLMASMNTARFDYLVNKAGFHHQYMYNSFQLNLGNDRFNNVSQLTETSNTDWSWSVLISDYDLDGDKDIYITNGYRRYALDNDLQKKVFQARQRYGNKVPTQVKRELYYEMPSEKLPNILFENKGDLDFESNANTWGLSDYTFSNGVAQGDFDNDGDLDLVVNNIDENTLLYKNNTRENSEANFLKVKFKGSLSESFPKVTIHFNNRKQFIEAKRIRGYRSSHENTALFGLGETETIDSLEVIWPSGKGQKLFDLKVNQMITVDEANANKIRSSKINTKTFFKNPGSLIDFVHKENPFDDFTEEILLPYKQSTKGPFISKGDINGDGLEDVFIGGASGQAGKTFIQTKSGFKVLENRIFEIDRGHEDMESVFFDVDNDSDLDLYVVSGGYEFEESSSYYTDRLYINDGQGNYSRNLNNDLNKFPQNGKTVATIDFDNDGDMDIIVGNSARPKKYPKHHESKLYENKGGILKDVTDTKAKGLLDLGIINKFITTDFNSDGLTDFIAIGEWAGIAFFKNNNGIFELSKKNTDWLDEKGWWYTIQETDINNDGHKDYILGNVGLNIKFNASKEKPFLVYAEDFDNNGTNDIVLSKKYNGEYVPVRGRECSSQQMPFIKEKFGTYNEFANATILDIYGDKLTSSLEKSVTEFRSIVLINTGDGTFTKQVLPKEAQMFPVLAIETIDINNDGYEDCIIAGNIYDTEVETPRLDAFSGLVLLSDGVKNYTVATYEQSGLSFTGDIKDILLTKTKSNMVLLATQNNGKIISVNLN